MQAYFGCCVPIIWLGFIALMMRVFVMLCATSMAPWKRQQTQSFAKVAALSMTFLPNMRQVVETR